MYRLMHTFPKNKKMKIMFEVLLVVYLNFCFLNVIARLSVREVRLCVNLRVYNYNLINQRISMI